MELLLIIVLLDVYQGVHLLNTHSLIMALILASEFALMAALETLTVDFVYWDVMAASTLTIVLICVCLLAHTTRHITQILPAINALILVQGTTFLTKIIEPVWELAQVWLFIDKTRLPHVWENATIKNLHMLITTQGTVFHVVLSIVGRILL